MKMNQFAFADTPATLNRKQYPYAASYALNQAIVERALESGWMGKTSPATEPLALTFPASLWRTTHQEVASGNTPSRKTWEVK